MPDGSVEKWKSTLWPPEMSKFINIFSQLPATIHLAHRDIGRIKKKQTSTTVLVQNSRLIYLHSYEQEKERKKEH